MSRGIYKYDLDDLGEATDGLGTLKSNFENASQVREGYDGAMGYDDLRDAVEEFVDNWKHNRERQLETLGSAQEALAGITQNYVDFDQAGVTTLNEGE